VLKIRDLEPTDTVARELALFKIDADAHTRQEISQLADVFGGRIVDVARRSVTVELTGSDEKVEAFEELVRPFGLIEMVRTGEIAVQRGRKET
jgi:acetolactate synthase-1/3 small subunit